jgi:hypothetical protein
MRRTHTFKAGLQLGINLILILLQNYNIRPRRWIWRQKDLKSLIIGKFTMWNSTSTTRQN